MSAQFFPVASTEGQHSIRTRRVAVAYPAGGLNRHYVQGDVVMSHVVAALSALFPKAKTSSFAR